MGSLIYTLSWIVFAALHSILARHSIQAQLEKYLGSYYRLTYNLLALLKIAIVFYIGSIFLSDSRFAFLDNNAAGVITSAIRLLGFIVLALALIAYDLGRFSGITQILTDERVSSSTSEPLQRRFLNKWVRHPLYTGAFLVLWGGAISSLGLWTALLGSLYLRIGSSFEERKLIKIYGDSYRDYQNEVPRFFPTLSFYKSSRR